MARVKHLWDFLIQCPRPIPDVGYHMRFKFARSNDGNIRETPILRPMISSE